MEIAEEICATVEAFEAFDPDCRLTISGGMNRPPYTKDAAIEALYQHARTLAKDIGFDLVACIPAAAATVTLQPHWGFRP